MTTEQEKHTNDNLLTELLYATNVNVQRDERNSTFVCKYTGKKFKWFKPDCCWRHKLFYPGKIWKLKNKKKS